MNRARLGALLGVFAGVLLVICIMQMNQVVQFLYFQFR